MPTVMCCFCGRGLERDASVTLEVFPVGAVDESQSLWCHPGCLAERVDPKVPLLLDAAEYDAD
jgi:hypothetical protein